MTGAKHQAKRLDYGDPMRVFAIVAVVVIHVSAPLVLGFGTVPNLEWWAGVVVNTVSRWCVPVFIMLSGALLLDPSREAGLGVFFRKRVMRVGIPLLVWSALYLLWVPWWQGNAMDLRGMFYQLMLGKPAYHMPFLFAIAGLYVITPALRRFIQAATRREREYLIAVAMLIPLLVTLFGVLRSPAPPSLAILKFLPYVGYFLLGYELRVRLAEGWDPGWYRRGFIACTAIMIPGTWALFTAFGPGHRAVYLNQYLSPLVIVMSVCVFLWMARSGAVARWGRGEGALGRFIVAHGAPASLGVYLIHPMLLDLLKRVGINGELSGGPIGIVITVTVCCSIALGLVRGIQMVPYLRRIVG